MAVSVYIPSLQCIEWCTFSVPSLEFGVIIKKNSLCDRYRKNQSVVLIYFLKRAYEIEKRSVLICCLCLLMEREQERELAWKVCCSPP